MSAILTQITQAKELFQESDCDGRSMALLGWPCLKQVNFSVERFLPDFHNLRQNTRVYDLKGRGAPENWSTEEGQGEPKIMVFHAIYGGGHVFGPYPIVNRPYNAQEYIR